METATAKVRILPQPNGSRPEVSLQESTQGAISQWVAQRFVFPKGEFCIMAENGQRISLPLPLLAALITLFVWIAGGTLAGVWLAASISANVSNLTQSQLQFQTREETEKKVMQDKIDLQQVYITDLREKIIRLEAKGSKN